MFIAFFRSVNLVCPWVRLFQHPHETKIPVQMPATDQEDDATRYDADIHDLHQRVPNGQHTVLRRQQVVDETGDERARTAADQTRYELENCHGQRAGGGPRQ
jgi:hypothetical protein